MSGDTQLASSTSPRGRARVLDLLAENRPFHSEFQLERFVITGSGRTTWGMYVQALRELRTRFEALKADYLRMRRIEWELPGADDMTAMERRSELESLTAINRDREREFVWFLGVVEALKAELGPLTQEGRARLEADTWRCRIREQAAVELRAHGCVSVATWSAIAALPLEWRLELAAQIQEAPGALVEEWFSREVSIPRRILRIGPEDVRPFVEEGGAPPCP